MVPSETDPALILLVEFNLVNTSAPESTQRTASGKAFPRGTDWERRPSLSRTDLELKRPQGQTGSFWKPSLASCWWMCLFCFDCHCSQSLLTSANIFTGFQWEEQRPALQEPSRPLVVMTAEVSRPLYCTVFRVSVSPACRQSLMSNYISQFINPLCDIFILLVLLLWKTPIHCPGQHRAIFIFCIFWRYVALTLLLLSDFSLFPFIVPKSLKGTLIALPDPAGSASAPQPTALCLWTPSFCYACPSHWNCLAEM